MATLHNRLSKIETEFKKYSDREQTMIEQASAAIVHLAKFKQMMAKMMESLKEMEEKIDLVADSLTIISKKIC